MKDTRSEQTMFELDFADLERAVEMYVREGWDLGDPIEVHLHGVTATVIAREHFTRNARSVHGVYDGTQTVADYMRRRAEVDAVTSESLSRLADVELAYRTLVTNVLEPLKIDAALAPEEGEDPASIANLGRIIGSRASNCVDSAPDLQIRTLMNTLATIWNKLDMGKVGGLTMIRHLGAKRESGDLVREVKSIGGQILERIDEVQSQVEELTIVGSMSPEAREALDAKNEELRTEGRKARAEVKQVRAEIGEARLALRDIGYHLGVSVLAGLDGAIAERGASCAYEAIGERLAIALAEGRERRMRVTTIEVLARIGNHFGVNIERGDFGAPSERHLLACEGHLIEHIRSSINTAEVRGYREGQTSPDADLALRRLGDEARTRLRLEGRRDALVALGGEVGAFFGMNLGTDAESLDRAETLLVGMMMQREDELQRSLDAAHERARTLEDRLAAAECARPATTHWEDAANLWQAETLAAIEAIHDIADYVGADIRTNFDAMRQHRPIAPAWVEAATRIKDAHARATDAIEPPTPDRVIDHMRDMLTQLEDQIEEGEARLAEAREDAAHAHDALARAHEDREY